MTTFAHARRRAQAGFTLIELMVAMIVSAIVVLGIFAFSTIQQSTANLHERNVRVQQALEGAMWSIASDVRQAGLGFARTCSELRVWDATQGRLVNPGAGDTPGAAYADAITGSAYWVLRDGVQAHWNSDTGDTLSGTLATSATPDSAADALDVVLAEGNYLASFGAFVLEAALVGTDEIVRVRTSNMLDNTDAGQLAQMQQLFPPGSFIALARTPGATANPFLPETHGQCVLMQITGDVLADPGDPQVWQLPIAQDISGFNNGLTQLLADTNGAPACPDENPACDDWDPGARDNAPGTTAILPLGRLRWSRYEIDYTIPTMPYLVRYDIIGYQAGVDPGNLGAVDYPHCTAGTCQAPQLHLPGSGSPPTAIAVGPMVEDMQVAVGCDGWTIAGADDALVPIPPPDAGFAEDGPAAGVALGPNLVVDENPVGLQRDRDEWLGNARAEQWAPDCVWYGSAEYDAAEWVGAEGNDNPPPAFRTSPQTLRVTLVASSEFPEEAGGLTTPDVLAVEDRPLMESLVGVRQRFWITERFSPRNMRWRDPTVN